MSVVYEGRDLKNRRTVAMRTLRPEQAQNPETRARFRKEARTMAFIQHPNVARVYDLWEDDQSAWVAMEYGAGRIAARCTGGKRFAPLLRCASRS